LCEFGVLATFSNDDDGDFVARNWCYIGLRAVTPVDLHEVRPGCHAIVTAVCKAQRTATRRLQAAPAADARSKPVSADNPSRANPSATRQHCLCFDPRHWSLPKQLHAAIFGAGDQFFVEHRPRQSESLLARKRSANRCAFLHQANSLEPEALTGI